MCELPSSLEAVMSLCIQVDDRLRVHWSAWKYAQRKALMVRDTLVSRAIRAFLVVERILVGDLSGRHSPPPHVACQTEPLPEPLSIHFLHSGAEQNFTDSSLASKLNIEIKLLHNPLHVSGLSGQYLPEITHVTEPLSFTMSGNHTEAMFLCVFGTIHPIRVRLFMASAT